MTLWMICLTFRSLWMQRVTAIGTVFPQTTVRIDQAITHEVLKIVKQSHLQFQPGWSVCWAGWELMPCRKIFGTPFFIEGLSVCTGKHFQSKELRLLFKGCIYFGTGYYSLCSLLSLIMNRDGGLIQHQGPYWKFMSWRAGANLHTLLTCLGFVISELVS